MLQHLKAVWMFRYFWMSLVRMDLRTRYRRSVLGIFWSLLQPIAMSGIMCVVFSRLFEMTKEVPGYPAPWAAYAAFLLPGMAVWEFIRNSAGIGCNALIHNEAYIRQCPLPYGIYPLRTVMGTAIHFMLSMLVIVTLVCLLRQSFEPLTMLWAVLPMFVLLFLFCWAVATLTAFATVYFHDTTHLVEVGGQLFFFMTPIIYESEKLGNAAWLAEINPVVVYLNVIRDPLWKCELPPMEQYFAAFGLTAVAVGLACGTIGWLQKRVIFQL